MLALLLSRPGEIVAREELRRTLWTDDTFVDFDHSLNSAVKRLRDTLHDDPDNPRLIETIPRHGYRFIAPVVETTPPNTVAPDASECKQAKLASAGVSRTWETMTGLTSGTASVVALILVLVVGAAAVLFHARVAGRVPAPYSKITIAVVPLHDLSETGGASSISYAMTQELVTRMGKMDPQHVSILRGAPLDSSASHNRSSGPVADYLLEGSTRVQGRDVRIAVQLVKAADLSMVWAEAYDRSLDDALAVQDDVAAAVTQAISEKLNLQLPAAHN